MQFYLVIITIVDKPYISVDTYIRRRAKGTIVNQEKLNLRSNSRMMKNSKNKRVEAFKGA